MGGSPAQADSAAFGGYPMNKSAKKENNRTLAEMLGATEKEAEELLSVTALITVSQDHDVGVKAAAAIQALLSRTITGVAVNQPAQEDAVEIVIGAARPSKDLPHIYVSFVYNTIVVSRTPETEYSPHPHPIAINIAASYVCGATLKAILGERLKYPSSDRVVIDLNALLGGKASLLDRGVVDFGEAFLAGAGAIGNGFVLGLSVLPLKGIVNVADDDHVSAGNLQRCCYFGEAEIGADKAEVLAHRGDLACGDRIAFRPHKGLLQSVPQRKDGAWLERLVVAVDSPRARRSLQKELPREVFDASTTGAEEIVFHFNHQPSDKACMACVYLHTPIEDAREHHVAEALGVSVNEVKELRVSERSAESIANKLRIANSAELVGQSYDTLFKNLCGSARVFTPEGRQVLTPFAFISTLAGLILALEFWRRIRCGHGGLFNRWNISPWANPLLRTRRELGQNPNCEVCADTNIGPVLHQIWSDAVAPRVDQTRASK